MLLVVVVVVWLRGLLWPLVDVFHIESNDYSCKQLDVDGIVYHREMCTSYY